MLLGGVMMTGSKTPQTWENGSHFISIYSSHPLHCTALAAAQLFSYSVAMCTSEIFVLLQWEEIPLLGRNKP